MTETEVLAQEYLAITKKIEELEAEKKAITDKIMETDFNKYVDGDKQLIRSTRRSVIIKKGLDAEVMEKFPEAIVKTETLIQDFIPAIKESMPEAFETKTSIDIKQLEKNIDAMDYLEVKETKYLQVRKANDENF